MSPCDLAPIVPGVTSNDLMENEAQQQAYSAVGLACLTMEARGKIGQLHKCSVSG